MTSGAADRAMALRTMAAELLAIAADLEQHDGTSPEGLLIKTADRRSGKELPDLVLLKERVRQEYDMRRARNRYFPQDLFGEPAWDILLDLFGARLDERMITVTSACIAADVPPTTALRWLGVLEQSGLVERVQNVTDQRSTLVRLTDQATSRMIDYFKHSKSRSSRPTWSIDGGLSLGLKHEAPR